MARASGARKLRAEVLQREFISGVCSLTVLKPQWPLVLERLIIRNVCIKLCFSVCFGMRVLSIKHDLLYALQKGGVSPPFPISRPHAPPIFKKKKGLLCLNPQGCAGGF